MEKGTFTLNRTGTFVLDGTSKNQCRTVGHRSFSYHVQLKVGVGQLDKNGFIVDHEVINNAVQKAVEMPTSCEVLCESICKEIESSLKRRKIKFQSIKVLVRAEPNPLAWMEFEMTPN